MRISDLRLTRSRAEMDAWPEGKFLVDTVNAHSFVVAQKDAAFADANLERNINQRGIRLGADDDTNEAGHSSH